MVHICNGVDEIWACSPCEIFSFLAMPREIKIFVSVLYAYKSTISDLPQMYGNRNRIMSMSYLLYRNNEKLSLILIHRNSYKYSVHQFDLKFDRIDTIQSKALPRMPDLLYNETWHNVQHCSF